jgi:hypothetical protein
MGFEAFTRGYSSFGEHPGNEALTAYGLSLLYDL